MNEQTTTVLLPLTEAEAAAITSAMDRALAVLQHLLGQAGVEAAFLISLNPLRNSPVPFIASNLSPEQGQEYMKWLGSLELDTASIRPPGTTH